MTSIAAPVRSEMSVVARVWSETSNAAPVRSEMSVVAPVRPEPGGPA